MTEKKYFPSKQSYNFFIGAWKKFYSDKQNRASLTPSHFLLYAIMRERDHLKCFSPVRNANKLDNSRWINYAMHEAFMTLGRYARYAKEPDKKCYGGETNKDKVERFLAPFVGCVTLDMFIAAVDSMPPIPAISVDSCPGIKDVLIQSGATMKEVIAYCSCK